MPKNYKGKLIVLDGVDYAGKDTQIIKLADCLYQASKANNILLTREPTMLTDEGRRIRELLATMKDPREKAEELTDLLIRDRRKLMSYVVEPNLEQGLLVLVNRHKYSTTAYQGTQGISTQKIIDAHKGMIKPDLVLILDINPDEYARRASISKGQVHTEVFDRNKEFISSVRKLFLQMRDFYPEENIKIIPAEGLAEDVHKKILAEVLNVLPENKKE